ncbi:MAG: response regulator [Planctomycetota bacterium]
MNLPAPNNNALSLAEAGDLLLEVQGQLNEVNAVADNLSDLLLKLLRIHQERCPTEELELFLLESVEALKFELSQDDPNWQTLDRLNDKAVDSWGEYLVELIDSDHDALEHWDAPSRGDEFSELSELSEENTLAPSSEEVEALLGQLGQLATSADSPEPDSARADPQPVHRNAISLESPSDNPRENVEQGSPLRAKGMGTESLDPELLEAFMEDASSCLGSIENALLSLETNAEDNESRLQILRELHTLKGASASVGLKTLAEHTHALEEELRLDEQLARATDINSLLQKIDEILSSIQPNFSQQTKQAATANQEQGSVSTSNQPSTGNFEEDCGGEDETVRVKASQLNRLMNMLAELVTLRNRRESEITGLQDIHRELMQSVAKMRLLRNDRDCTAPSSTSLQFSEIANDVLESAQSLKESMRPFSEANGKVSGFIGQFRQELVEIRRTPIAGLFRRLQRVVRDAAQVEGKQVKLHLVGQDAGIERSLQQHLYEPLLHILRNCVCHGIESPEERSKANKPPVGTISLAATSGPDLLAIEISDDGKGLDYEAIRRRGIERGLLSADQSASQDDLARLIFQPGFSTRESTNQIAGRGVGMDVVAANLEKMRGWLEVDSKPNRGTTIRLNFPIASVIQHAMIVRIGEQLFAMPMESVHSAGEVPMDIPHACFADLLGVAPANSTGNLADKQAIVVVDDLNKGTTLALLVDEIVGPEELVVRPLPSLLRTHPFCGGAALSGSGHTVLLLDTRRIVQTSTPRSKLSNAYASSPKQSPCVLVVDDSISARKRVVRSLSRYDLEIVEATNGQEAISVLKSRAEIVAVFSDMEMPQLDGMGLLQSLASRDDAPPVVIISSRSESKFTERARDLGAHSYLLKPLEDSAMDTTLAKIESLQHILKSENENA